MENIDITGVCYKSTEKETWQLLNDRIIFRKRGLFGTTEKTIFLADITTFRRNPEKGVMQVEGNKGTPQFFQLPLYFDMSREATKYETVLEHIGNNCSDYEYITEKIFEGKEWTMRCNVCGEMFCYTYNDLKKNEMFANSARAYTKGAIVNALVGTQIGMYENMKLGNDAMGRIMDYSRCPHCNSSSLTEITKEEWDAGKVVENKPVQTAATTSAADEIKKFKELLDCGIITQEEFDAKKKQLLGL